MKKITFLASLLFISIYLFGQHQIGYKVITFTDPDRSNREIETYIYYPASTAGEDVPISNGTFPVVVFGHGTVMADPELYQYLWDELVPEGYICLFPTTEGGSPLTLSPPRHEAFGLDLKFLNSKIISEGNNSSSFFYGKINPKTAIMGHSLGGKAAYIAGANNTDVTTIVSLAAALGNPPFPFASYGYDALTLSLPFVTAPTVVFDAEFDCVVPDDEGHQVVYDELTNECKFYIKILGGGHCYYASQEGSGLSACESLENCSDDFTITREQQNEYLVSFLLPWLNYKLKDNVADGLAFRALINTSSLIDATFDCPLNNTSIENITSSSINIFPNPASGSFNIQLPNAENVNLNIKSITGATVFSNIFETNNITIKTENFSKGLYFVEIIINNQKVVKKIIID